MFKFENPKFHYFNSLSSMSWLKKLANLWLPVDVLICTMDVTSLYTNIDQEECVDIIKKRLEETNIEYKLPKPPKPFVKRILELILKRNCFKFDGEFYIQTWGVAMGKIASPEISDLVMYGLEKEFILTDPNILYYARYRDDLLWFFINQDLMIYPTSFRSWTGVIKH